MSMRCACETDTYENKPFERCYRSLYTQNNLCIFPVRATKENQM